MDTGSFSLQFHKTGCPAAEMPARFPGGGIQDRPDD